jgi:hypothetical protein
MASIRSTPWGSVMPARTAAVADSSGLVREPLPALADPLTPIVLEGRYRLLVGSLWRLSRSRRGGWALAAGSGVLMCPQLRTAGVCTRFVKTGSPLRGVCYDFCP